MSISMKTNRDRIEFLQTELFKIRNPEKAIQAEKYMKNLFPFLGVAEPLRKVILDEMYKSQPIKSREELVDLVTELWAEEYREFQHVSLKILFKYRKFLIEKDIDFIINLIQQKSWWDTVDLLAASILGYLFVKYPLAIETFIPDWIAHSDMWVNRTAIIFQLKYKNKTDTALLKKCIVPHAESKEFFHQKAIGWALREYSKTDAAFVISFVESHKLKALSVREALRLIKKAKN